MRTALVAGIMLTLAMLATACSQPPPSDASAPNPPAGGANLTLLAAPTPTATPALDLSATLPPRAAVALLSQEPELDAIISAVAAQDIDALLDVIDWEPRICSGYRGSAICDEYDGRRIDTVRVGPTTEYAARSVIRRYLERLFEDPPLTLKLAVRSITHENWIYILGFEGPPKLTGFAPLASADSRLTGIRLDVDLSRVQPVVHFDLLTDTSSATDAGRHIIESAPNDYRLLLFTE